MSMNPLLVGGGLITPRGILGASPLDRLANNKHPCRAAPPGDSFFAGDPHSQKLARAFAWLAAEPGVGKTSAMRHLSNRSTSTACSSPSSACARPCRKLGPELCVLLPYLCICESVARE